jgi:L-threonylcarbamoyladenylate synthase
MITETLSVESPEALEQAVSRAAHLLRGGEVVALPTETVYGLAADALCPDAALKIFEAKERPFFDPLIVHLPDRSWLERLCAIPPESRALVDALITRFWPGPLTLVLPRTAIVPDVVTSGLETVAVRMSAHPVFRGVCEPFGGPIAAPSANRFGRISPTAAAHVQSELNGRIPLILDGGATEHGLESTIIRVEGDKVRMLRSGPVTAEEIAFVWRSCCVTNGHTPDAEEVARFFASLGVSHKALLRGDRCTALEAPGQMKSHYAPRTPLKLYSRGTHFALPATRRIGSLAFSEASNAADSFAVEEILSSTGDLREAAATLFAKLRRLDEAGLDLIIAETVPEQGLGIAIMDRLRKAAAAHAH